MKRLISGVVIGGIAVCACTSATEDDTTRDTTGAITEAGDLGVLAVEAGDCVQLPDQELIKSVGGVPCDGPHDAQVYSVLDLGGGRLRDDSDIEDEAFERCLARWGDAVHTDWESDTFLDLLAIYPTSQSWAFGDREVLCLVVRLDGDPLTADLL